jgi:hypothetical protein
MVWIAIIISLASAVYSYIQMQNMPKGLDDGAEPKRPTIEEGKTLGVVFGTVKITSPNIYWWGDLEGVAIKK